MAFLKRFLIAVLVLLPSQSIAVAEECRWDHKIWATESDGDRWIFYLADEGFKYTDAFMELWRDRKLAARIYGTYGCSNGMMSICYFEVMKEYRPRPDNRTQTYESGDALSLHVVEEIRLTDNWRDDILLIESLREQYFFSQNEHVDKFIDFEDHMLVPPTNAFKFLACRKDDVSIEPRTDL